MSTEKMSWYLFLNDEYSYYTDINPSIPVPLNKISVGMAFYGFLLVNIKLYLFLLLNTENLDAQV
jgi:hypothetical protein